jgi:hypothetical protein
LQKKKNLGILKVNDENSRIRIQEPDADPFVRGMDPRIRIHTKMSRIRNTGGRSTKKFRGIFLSLFKRRDMFV